MLKSSKEIIRTQLQRIKELESRVAELEIDLRLSNIIINTLLADLLSLSQKKKKKKFKGGLSPYEEP